MKHKTSITLPPETLAALDELTEPTSNRSRTIERAVIEFLERRRRSVRDQRDLESLDQHADELNRDNEDLIEFQADLW